MSKIVQLLPKPSRLGARASVFVGGPIQHACHAGGFTSSLQSRLLAVIEALRGSGCRVFSAHVTEEFGVRTPDWTPEEVSMRDYQWMNACDAFVAVLPVEGSGEVMRTDGTHMELGWASALAKPIVLVARAPLAAPYSHLVRGLHAICRTQLLDVAAVDRQPDVVVGAVDELLSPVEMTSVR